MALDQTEVVDILLLSRDQTKVFLAIYNGGQVPRSRGMDVKVVCLHPPTEEMKKVEGMEDPGRPKTFPSVEVRTDAEFRAAIVLPKPPTPRPWWKS